MKKPFEENLKALGVTESLTKSERARMRSMIIEYARMKPVRDFRTTQTIFHTFSLYLRRPALGGLALLLVVALSGTGIAYAAEGTLPGDLLYPVKINVVEPIQTALITSPTAKAAWHMELAQRRLDEAATLAKKGTLTPKTEAQLAVQFTQNTQEAQTEIATSSSQIQISDDAFASRLATYDSVLARAETHTDASTTAALRNSIRTELALISPKETGVSIALRATTAPRAMNMFMASSASTTLSTTGTTTETATDSTLAQIGTTVTQAVTNSANLITENASALDASSTASAQAELKNLQNLVDQAKILYAEGNHQDAYQDFEQALVAASQLQVLTHAAATLKIDAFPQENASSSATSTVASSTPPQDPQPQENSRKKRIEKTTPSLP